ncbi:MAG: prepilin-type N-terminal cleavage/methylation domain-containing protein [Verrucomicrobia bacterium]|nr:prepilin-type N-terminal cleavage/methylation domain-containing protein [Verrucomicrobiota bacterium]
MPSKSPGFSLVEVLIAVVILGFLTMSVMTGTMAVRKSAEATVYQAVAESITAGFMEQLKGEEFGILRAKATGDDNSPFTFVVLNYSDTPGQSANSLQVDVNTQDFVQLRGPQGIPINSGQMPGRPDSIVVRARMDYDFRITLSAHPSLPVVTILIEYRYRMPNVNHWVESSMIGARSSVTR